MANASAKGRLKANQKRLSQLGVYILVCNTVFLVSKAVINRNTLDIKQFIFFMSIYNGLLVMSLGMLFSFAKPVYQNGELMDGGGDITTGTMVEYLHDMIYIAGLAQLVHCFWNYGWTLLLIIPLAAAIMLGQWIWAARAASTVPMEADTGSEQGLNRKARRREERKRK